MWYFLSFLPVWIVSIIFLTATTGCAKQTQKKNDSQEVEKNEIVCGKIKTKGISDPLEDAIVVRTDGYCVGESLYNNVMFLSMDFKNPPVKTEKEFVVSVYFANGDADSYWRARFLLSGKLVNVGPEEVRIDEPCDLEDKCTKRKGFMFFVKREVLNFWAENGGTIRFGEKTDIIIDKNEVKDFLSVVDKSVVNL